MAEQHPFKGAWMFALVVFLAGAGYLLWTEHKAHVVQFLPWLILLLCPLMHLFMHHGHGGGGHGSGDHSGHSHESDGQD